MDKLEKVNKILWKSAITLLVIFIILMVDKLLSIYTDSFWGINLHSYNWPHFFVQVYHFVIIFTLIGGLFCLLIALILWLYRYLHRDEDYESRKHAQSPLHNVNKKQEKMIIALLKSAGQPAGSSNKMKRANVAKVLSILKAKNRLDDSGDFKKVRLWVEKVTGLRDSDDEHFKQEYNRVKVNPDYEQKIDEILHIID